MFPPETTQTRGPRPPFPASAAARARAPAPSDMTRCRSARSFTEAAASFKETGIEPASSLLAICHISESTLFPPAPSTKLGIRLTSLGSPAANEAVRGAAVSGSHAYTLTFSFRGCIADAIHPRSEEHTSELQSHLNLVCRLLLEKKKKKNSKINEQLCVATWKKES